MKVIHWKNRPEVWSTLTVEGGMELETETKEEMVLRLASEGWELDGQDWSCVTDVSEVWNVKRFPGNSLEKDRQPSC